MDIAGFKKNLPLETPRDIVEGVWGHILNCGRTANNTCIIMLLLSLAKPGNPASVV